MGRTVITVECFDDTGKRVHYSASAQQAERRVDAARLFTALDAADADLFRLQHDTVIHLPFVGFVARFRQYPPTDDCPGHGSMEVWRTLPEFEFGNYQVSLDEAGNDLGGGTVLAACPLPGPRSDKVTGPLEDDPRGPEPQKEGDKE